MGDIPRNATEEAIVARVPWTPPGQTIGTAGPLQINGIADLAQKLPGDGWFAFPVHVRKGPNSTAEVYVDGRLRRSEDMPEPPPINKAETT